MSEQSYRIHPSNPAAQPFKGAKDTAKRGWWLKGNNNTKKKDGK